MTCIARSLRYHALAAWLTLAAMSATAQDEPDPAYWRLADIRAELAGWQAAHPEIVAWRSIGTSGQGQAIDAVCISDNVTARENEPCLIFHAAQHANECNGTTAIMKMIETLLAGYGRDPDVTARIDGLQMWFIPVMNPDGHDHVFGGGDPDWAAWRKNLSDNDGNGRFDAAIDGVDLNRNWDWLWAASPDSLTATNKYKGPAPFSEPETAALRDLILAEHPVLTVDYHSPVTITWRNYIFFPWLSQFGEGESPDYPVAEAIAGGWAGATLTESGQPFNFAYAHDTLSKQQNWTYGKLGVMSLLMEISEKCWWSGAAVDTVGQRVARGSVYLLDRVLDGPGIRGVVTDAVTGLPLRAEVRLSEMHSDYVGPHLTDGEFGRYHRLTLSGEYTVSVHCEGHLTRTVSTTVPATGWSQVDFALIPEVPATPGPPAKD